MNRLLTGFSACLFALCSFKAPGQSPKRWDCSLGLQNESLHFTLEEKTGQVSPPQFIIWNGKERIDLNFNQLKGDSLYCPIAIFENQLILPKQRGETFSGLYARPGQPSIPFHAKAAAAHLKKQKNNSLPGLKRSYFVYFFRNQNPVDSGIFQMEQYGDSLYGTVLNETGDFRFLNGRIAGSSAYLQTFDGGHSYHFKFQISGDSIVGNFISGPKGNTIFRGSVDPDKRLKAGFEVISRLPERLSFYAFDVDGKRIDQADFKDQALVIQLLGSWCPNCLDETRFLTEAYAKKPSHVQFIGLAFERKNNRKEAFERIDAVKNRLGVPYPIFWGGQASKDSAAKVFGNQFKVYAFPTTLFIDKNGKVKKIHSGFSGPATGEGYAAWKREFEEILNAL